MAQNTTVNPSNDSSLQHEARFSRGALEEVKHHRARVPLADRFFEPWFPHLHVQRSYQLRRLLRTEALVEGWHRGRWSGPTSLLDTSGCLPRPRDFMSPPCLCTGFWLKKPRQHLLGSNPASWGLTNDDSQCKTASRTILHAWSSTSHHFIITP